MVQQGTACPVSCFVNNSFLFNRYEIPIAKNK